VGGAEQRDAAAVRGPGDPDAGITGVVLLMLSMLLSLYNRRRVFAR